MLRLPGAMIPLEQELQEGSPTHQMEVRADLRQVRSRECAHVGGHISGKIAHKSCARIRPIKAQEQGSNAMGMVHAIELLEPASVKRGISDTIAT